MNYDCDFLKPYLESHLLIKTGEVSIFHVSLHNSIDLGDGQFSERCNVDGSFSTAMRYRLFLEKLNIAIVAIREGVKKRFFLGLCPRRRTPPTHCTRLGLH